MPYIFSLNFPPRWELKRELGEGFIDLGAAASALAIFEELKLWEEVIRCYQVLAMLVQYSSAPFEVDTVLSVIMLCIQLPTASC